MPAGEQGASGQSFRVLAVTQGAWGERIASNIVSSAPSDWEVYRWSAPGVIPPIVDEPETYLPDTLPASDLVLALGEVPGLAQLVPDIVRLCGAKAVIAPIDRNEALPRGLVNQLRRWLERVGVAVVFPKPFCSLTETAMGRKPRLEGYENPLIQRFAAAFGRPEFQIKAVGGQIVEAIAVHDTPCGCARYVAAGLIGQTVEEALDEAGMLHHHYPCLASMSQDADYHDTLMHVSGNILKDSVKEALSSYLGPVPYVRPAGFVESEPRDSASA